MKLIRKILALFLALTAQSTLAQNTDSVIVIYKNQKTVIPLPAYKCQSAISYSDSIRVIDIGVSQRKPGEPSLFPKTTNGLLIFEQHKSTSKWFSQIEAGYFKSSTEYVDEYSSTRYDVAIPVTLTTNTSMTDLCGYQVKLLLQEREYFIDKKKSFVSAFVLGYGQSFLKAKQVFTYNDTTDYPPYIIENDYNLIVNSFQFLYKIGMSYHNESWIIPARINFGNYLGFSFTRIIDKNGKFQPIYYHINSTLLQPYLGLEISKIGILFTMDLNVPHNSHNIVFKNDIGGGIGLSLTYRLF